MLLPVRNGANYIVECLSSLFTLPQGAGRFTVLLIDDASSDGSADLATSFVESLNLSGNVNFIDQLSNLLIFLRLSISFIVIEN